MRATSLIVLLAVSLSLPGCLGLVANRIDTTLSTWVGQPREKLIAAFGRPAYETPTMMVFEQMQTDTTSIHGRYVSSGYNTEIKNVFTFYLVNDMVERYEWHFPQIGQGYGPKPPSLN